MAWHMLLCNLFFFKQKTAYEMRISDWSSDVCSSDLEVAVIALFDLICLTVIWSGMRDFVVLQLMLFAAFAIGLFCNYVSERQRRMAYLGRAERSEARRVGNECIRKCRSRGTPYH